MMIIQYICKCGLLLILLGLLPFLIGSLLTKTIRKKNIENLAFDYLLGLIAMLAISEILAVPFTMAKRSFFMFFVSYSSILIGLAGLSVATGYKRMKTIACQTVLCIQRASKLWWLVGLLIVLPTFVLLFITPYTYGDDRTYIAMVNDMISNNNLYLTEVKSGTATTWIQRKYALSSYWAWLAWLAKASGIHPLILCKSVLLLFFVPLAYLVQGLLGRYLLKNDSDKLLIFMLLNIGITLFGGFSNYTVTYRIYVWPWQSKAVLAMVILPFLLYYCCVILDRHTTVWEYFLLSVIVLAACASTLNGAGIALVMVGLLALLFAFWKRCFGIIIKALLACWPVFLLVFIYLKYNFFLNVFHFFS